MPEIFKHVFAINGTWIFGPDNYQEEPVPVVGYNQLGEPVRQGYPTFTFTWTFLKQEHMTALINAYNAVATSPLCTVKYWAKETGTIQSFTGMMHEPIVGARQIIYYANIAVKFTRCEPA